MDKRDLYKTAKLAYNDECVRVQHVGDGHYKVTTLMGSVMWMPAEENGIVYLTGFVL